MRIFILRCVVVHIQNVLRLFVSTSPYISHKSVFQFAFQGSALGAGGGGGGGGGVCSCIRFAFFSAF